MTMNATAIKEKITMSLAIAKPSRTAPSYTRKSYRCVTPSSKDLSFVALPDEFRGSAANYYVIETDQAIPGWDTPLMIVYRYGYEPRGGVVVAGLDKGHGVVGINQSRGRFTVTDFGGTPSRFASNSLRHRVVGFVHVEPLGETGHRMRYQYSKYGFRFEDGEFTKAWYPYPPFYDYDLEQPNYDAVHIAQHLLHRVIHPSVWRKDETVLIL